MNSSHIFRYLLLSMIEIFIPSLWVKTSSKSHIEYPLAFYGRYLDDNYNIDNLTVMLNVCMLRHYHTELTFFFTNHQELIPIVSNLSVVNISVLSFPFTG